MFVFVCVCVSECVHLCLWLCVFLSECVSVCVFLFVWVYPCRLYGCGLNGSSHD